MRFGDVLLVLRPKQWVKNLLVFAAIIFSKHLFDRTLLFNTLMTFFVFCSLSSAAYILNDIVDVKADRTHPWKCKRPLASGAVKILPAKVLGLFLLFLSFGVAYFINLKVLMIIFVYFLLQLGYSLGLKNRVILDVMILSSGFVLRAIAGGVAISVQVTNWLLLCTFLLALFLSLCKRRQELVVLGEEAGDHRRVLAEYSRAFIDSLIPVVTGATVVAYALYTVAPEIVLKFGTDKLIFTLPFVLYGIFRYLFLLHQKEKGDNPTQVLLSDTALQIDILLWLAVCLFLIYFKM